MINNFLTQHSLIPTVFIIDDDSPIRDSLRLLLESLNKKVKAFSSAQEFLEHYNSDIYGCLLLDIKMPGMNGLELQNKLNKLNSQLPIIFITGHGDVPMAVRAMREGAFDFIQKPYTAKEILSSIDNAFSYLSQNNEKNEEYREAKKRIANLTCRELQVLQLLTQGKSNKTIATELSLSQRTVEAHRAHIMDKLQIDSLAKLVRMGLIYNQELA